jgi:hypothetical protein
MAPRIHLSPDGWQLLNAAEEMSHPRKKNNRRSFGAVPLRWTSLSG